MLGELAGGHVGRSDGTVRHAVARETLEETGQVVKDVLGRD